MDAQHLTRALGGKWRGRSGLAFCPAHPNTRTPALSLRQGEDGRLLAHCFAGCDYRQIQDALRGRGLLSGHSEFYPPDQALQAQRKQQALADVRRRADQAFRCWRDAQPIHGTLAESYLRGRGITCALPETLRFHSAAWHGPSARHVPAMIALIEGAADFAIHRTYLAPNGAGKASGSQPRMMLGASAGGAVQLVEGAGPLVVAEGIETALSLASGLVAGPATICAALSASGMAALTLRGNPHQLIIASDGDCVGREAGSKLAERASVLGWDVRILPAPEGRDWNDVLMMKGGKP